MKSIILTVWMVCVISFIATPRASARSLNVELNIEALHCLQPAMNSPHGEDQIFLVARGKAGKRDYTKRLPDERDYYRGVRGNHLTLTGWTDGNNEKRGKPVLWRGTLREGDNARFTVVFVAQQNEDLPIISRDVAGLWGERAITSYVLENKHDLLGSFTVVVNNIDDRLHVTWNAGEHARHLVDNGNAKPFGRDAAFFELRGTGESSYNMIANVRIR